MLVVAALLAAGCSGEAGPDEAAAGPLAPYRELAYGTAGEQEDRSQAQQRRYEEHIAACMKDAGFEYVPAVTSAAGPVLADDVPAPGSRAFREQFGYGVTTDPWQAQVSTQDVVDANAAYRATLTPGAQEAFDAELHGTGEKDAAGVVAQVGGCANAAWDAVYGVLLAHPDWQELLAEMDALYDRVDDASAVQGATSDWSRCMAERGHAGLTDPQAAEASVRAVLDAAQTTGTDGLVQVDAEQVAAVRRAETVIAVADLDCQEEVDLAARRAAALRDLEEEFVRQHGDELEAWALAERSRADAGD